MAPLLIIDETHTISSGLGGYTRVHGLQPDMLVVGKCVAGGMPTAVWGLSQPVAERYATVNANRPSGHSGMGTTLSANPMQFACLRATLAEVMTASAYAQMERRAERLASGLAASIAANGAPWHVVRVGARVEFICAPGPLHNGAEAALGPYAGGRGGGACRPAEPRLSDRALSQHDADQPRHRQETG